MDLEKKSADVYGLITKLSEHIYRSNCSVDDQSHLSQKCNAKVLKRLRSKAFEILLNKSTDASYTRDNAKCEGQDPVAEILKHAFALKVGAGYASKASELEKLLEELPTEDTQVNSTVYLVLQFLARLKSFQSIPDTEINIFHYGKPNPCIPDGPYSDNDAPMFQVSPVETFDLSEKFDAMLRMQEYYIEHEANAKCPGRLFLDHLKSSTTVDVESVRYDSGSIKALVCAPICSSDGYSMDFSASCFLPSDLRKPEIKECFSFGKGNLPTDLTIPDQQAESVCEDSDSVSDSWKSMNNSESNEYNKVQNLMCSDYTWDVEDLENAPSYLRSWETLGLPETAKQPLFVTDTVDAILYMAKIKQTSILSLLPEKILHSVSLLKEIPTEEFLKNVKLLMLGIESDSFQYNKKIGFNLQNNIAVSGITPEALAALCQEPIEWGNCYRFLTKLTEPDLQTGKLHQQGFIFKAMCTNIKELLLYYQAALLRIFANAESNGLLNVLKEIRPVANLITEVTRLCRYHQKNSSSEEEGSGILTHIYREVTKITNPRVALVFYSILKSCCEVYFRFLQKWLFEGKCDDIYDEFMIRVRPQYLRSRGHKFWTKSFSVHQQAVPGFLCSLSDSILQCGKAVRLLNTCDPKNPICSVFSASHPELRVCLSVTMLREQLAKCQEYAEKGNEALSPIVSLSSAIQHQKDVEKERANLAIRAQQETLSRIKQEQAEIAKNIAESKRELLKTLKEQAKEIALHREKEKEAELLADRLLLEKIRQEETEAQEIQQKEGTNFLKCYDEAATNADIQCMRANWRIKRMNHSSKRISVLAALDQDLCISPDIAMVHINNNTELEKDNTNPEINTVVSENISSSENSAELQTFENRLPLEDENKNITCDEGTTLQSPQNSSVNLTERGIDKSEIKFDTTESKCLPSSNEKNEESNSNQNIPNKTFDNKINTPENLDVQNKNTETYLNVYKRNNERSNFQEFLRSEVAKKDLTQAENNTNTKESFTKNEHIINRPNFLTINKIDCTTAAELNKLKVLQQEYGMTPNNNEVNLFFMTEKKANLTLNTDNGNIIENETKLYTADNQINRNDHINRNQMKDLSTVEKSDCLKTSESAIIETERSSNSMEEANENKKVVNDSLNNKQEVLLRNINNVATESNIGTPMSCTTDNFAPSADTPISQSHIGELVTPSEMSSKMSASYEPIKSFMEESSNSSWQSRLTFSNSMNFAPDFSPTLNSSLSLTIADVESIDNPSLEVYLEKSITIPLQVQSRLVNNALIKYFINEHKIFLHLQSLRSYFFLLNGEFAKSLTDSLYTRLYEISVPIELFNSATLTNLLEKALVNSFTSSYINSELLNLSAIDIPQQLHISDPDALDCLCLNYKISWPLNIILDDIVMLQYSKVFKFLIMIGRVSWVLQEDFNILKNERKAAMSVQYHKLQLYRHSMTQFMNALYNYLTCSVLHASWAEFEKDLQNCVTLDQIYFSHVTYIKKILSRCMLNVRGEKIRTCLNNVFKVILQFHNRLRSQAWVASSNHYIHPNFKKLEQMYKAFCELRTYMAHVAFKLATSGYQPHLMHFLNALNINYMYDLTVKSS